MTTVIKTPTIKKIYKMTEFDLLRTKVSMGNMYLCVDTQKLYFDRGNSADDRTIYDYISVKTINDLMYNITPAFGKSYYCWEDNSLWIWTNKWQTLYADTTYPSAYVYDGIPDENNAQNINSIYRYDMPNYPADDNGLLKDGSVIIRDRNRIIKGKLSIDDGNDNLIISSFLGGGIRFLPNGKADTSGELYICDDTIPNSDIDIVTQKFSQLEYSKSESNVEIDIQTLRNIQDEFNLNDCKAPERLNINDVIYILANKPDESSMSYIVKYKQKTNDLNFFTVINNIHIVPINGKPTYSYVRSELHTMNNDFYIDFSDDPDKDYNLYQKPSHIYKVYHEGNLDVSSIKIMTPLQIYNKLLDKEELPDPFNFNVTQLEGHSAIDFAKRVHKHTTEDITDITSFVEKQTGAAVKTVFNDMHGIGITGSYNTAQDILELTANPFSISLTGDVTGSGRVNNLTDTVIEVNVDPTKHRHQDYINRLDALQLQIDNIEIDTSSTYTRDVIDSKILAVTGTLTPQVGKPLLVNENGILAGTISNATQLNHYIDINLKGGVTGNVVVNGSETSIDINTKLNLDVGLISDAIDDKLATNYYKTTIGNNLDTTFVIRHNLNSTQIFVQFRDAITKQQVFVPNKVLDESRLQVDSNVVIPENGMEVVIYRLK